MQLLGLNEDTAGCLPASRYPERADVYLCDKCGEDLTRRFFVRKGHGSTPLGPPTFYCLCGARYLSGTREWDQMEANEKRTALRFMRISALLAFPPLISLAATALGFYQHEKGLTISGFTFLVLTSPLSLFLVFSFLSIRDIAASIYRTRISKGRRS
jgi:hypothetical protein